ncbi:MAG: hypothetical protein P0Y52_07845 [Candidatus Brevundimonas phytovorans]|nr:hypothetical protein [Brevundimonas sp.]WEK56470.1 MAG: hypothetical protein P0Y52_07845 [Brevundimonas sp.]
MTTIKATAAQSIALERRRLTDRAALVRGRVEATPGCNLLPKIANVENRLKLMQYGVAKTLLDEIDDTLEDLRRKADESELAQACRQQDELLAERGVETFEVGAVRARDGWQWLTSRKPARLSAVQIATGDRYAALHASAHRDGLSTSANDNGGGGDLTVQQVMAAAELRHAQRQALAAVHAHIARATGSERLAALLEAVCGRGSTPRQLAGNDDRKAAAVEVELRLALDMASVAFKMTPRMGEAA